MRSILLLAAAALSLTACSPTDQPANYTNYVTANSDATDCGLASNTVNDEKALFALETFYNIPADAYVRALGTNKLPADVKAYVQPKLVKLYEYVKLGRTAYKAGDGCSLKNYRDLADALNTQLNLKLGTAKPQ